MSSANTLPYFVLRKLNCSCDQKHLLDMSVCQVTPGFLSLHSPPAPGGVTAETFGKGAFAQPGQQRG